MADWILGPTWRRHIPFDGEPPAVTDGDRVECRDAYDVWHPMVARSGPRYDDVHAFARPGAFLTVAVSTPEDFAHRGEDAPEFNWPAEDVRVRQVEESSCASS